MDLKTYFEGKTIWVTGASAGIGRATAIALSEFNTQLILSSRSEDKLQAVANDCQHNNILVAAGDLSDKAENKDIIENIHSHFGALDIALLNAGTCEYVDVRNFDSALFERVFQANYFSMVYGIEAALPLLRQSQSAQIVGMSSTAYYIGMPRSEAYGSSKAAIAHMLNALRISLLNEKIPVSVICPGFVETPLTDKNDFPMPGKISAEEAAIYIIKGIAKQSEEIHFPKMFSIIMKLFASLPYFIQTPLLAKMVKKP